VRAMQFRRSAASGTGRNSDQNGSRTARGVAREYKPASGWSCWCFVDRGDFPGMRGIHVETLPLVPYIDGVDLRLQRPHGLALRADRIRNGKQDEVHNQRCKHDGPAPTRAPGAGCVGVEFRIWRSVHSAGAPTGGQIAVVFGRWVDSRGGRLRLRAAAFADREAWRGKAMEEQDSANRSVETMRQPEMHAWMADPALIMAWRDR